MKYYGIILLFLLLCKRSQASTIINFNPTFTNNNANVSLVAWIRQQNGDGSILQSTYNVYIYQGYVTGTVVWPTAPSNTANNRYGIILYTAPASAVMYTNQAPYNTNLTEIGYIKGESQTLTNPHNINFTPFTNSFDANWYHGRSFILRNDCTGPISVTLTYILYGSTTAGDPPHVYQNITNHQTITLESSTNGYHAYSTPVQVPIGYLRSEGFIEVSGSSSTLQLSEDRVYGTNVLGGSKSFVWNCDGWQMPSTNSNTPPMSTNSILTNGTLTNMISTNNNAPSITNTAYTTPYPSFQTNSIDTNNIVAVDGTAYSNYVNNLNTSFMQQTNMFTVGNTQSSGIYRLGITNTSTNINWMGTTVNIPVWQFSVDIDYNREPFTTILNLIRNFINILVVIYIFIDLRNQFTSQLRL